MASTQDAVTKAMCTVCHEEDLVDFTSVGGNPVCDDCMVEGIIPKLVDALDHEAAYPPTWGRYTLDPKDFKVFIEDADGFLREYRKKEVEYGTPLATRLYCQECQAFCGEKDERRLIRLGCPTCKALICSACGAVDKNDGEHECVKEDESFEGLVKGKDYQLCPNSKCGMKVELKDGCNAMRCTMSSCKQDFCFVCGEPAGHDSNHWMDGGECPRWNQPASEHAQFDRVQPIDLQQAQQQLRAGFEGIMADFAAPPPDAIPDVRELMAEIDQVEVDDIENTLRVAQRTRTFLNMRLPFVALRQENDAARLAAEADMAAQLEAHPIATLMHHQQNQLVALTQVAETMIVDHEAEDRDVPPFLPAVIDLFLKLSLNLDIYIYFARLYVGIEDFMRRDQEIQAMADGEHFGSLVVHFPMALRILSTYRLIARDRMDVAQGLRFVFAIEQNPGLIGGRLMTEEERARVDRENQIANGHRIEDEDEDEDEEEYEDEEENDDDDEAVIQIEMME